MRAGINFDELREIAAVGKRGCDGRNVGAETIGGDLEALLRRRLAQTLDEG